MFKKKRLFLLLCLVLVTATVYYQGVYVAGACVLGAVFLLALLKCWHVLTAHRGMRAIEAASTRYNYNALIEGLPTADTGGDAWSFIVLGDTRNNTSVARRLYRRAKEEAPAMLFHTGDIVRGGTARELLHNHIRLIEEEGLTMPMFCAAGNHERGSRRDFGVFKRLYGGDRFAFPFRNCLFVGFNNSGRPEVGDEDLEFLSSALAPEGLRKFVFIHVPPAFFEATFVSDARRRGFKQNADAFHQLMRRHQVDEVFMAHIHGYASTVIDGVRYTLTAGGGAPLSRRIAPEGRRYHMIKVAVRDDIVERKLLLYDQAAWSERDIV